MCRDGSTGMEVMIRRGTIGAVGTTGYCERDKAYGAGMMSGIWSSVKETRFIKTNPRGGGGMRLGQSGGFVGKWIMQTFRSGNTGIQVGGRYREIVEKDEKFGQNGPGTNKNN